MVSLHSELTSPALNACKLCVYFGTLAPETAEEWAAELAQPVSVVGNTAVVNALQRRGVLVSESAVRRHRARHVTV